MTIDTEDYHGKGHPGRATFAGKDLADEMGIFTMEYHVYIYLYIYICTLDFEIVCKYPYHHIEDVLGIQLLNLKLCLSIHVIL